MSVTGGIVVYVIVWWLVFFAVLPWGVRHDGERPRGADPGAPVTPDLARKALVTSVIAAAIWAVIFFAVRAGAFDFYPSGSPGRAVSPA